MPQRPLDGGDAAALLLHYYHLKPWELDDLEDEQRDLLLAKIGLLRFYNDLPTLTYQFSKFGDEQIDGILHPKAGQETGPRARAWEQWGLKPYGLYTEQAAEGQGGPQFTLSPEAAEGILRWVESRDLYKLPEGSLIWRLYLLPIKDQLMAQAKKYKSPR